jgi:isoamylase
MTRSATIEGTPYPAGATWLPEENAFNFSVWAPDAGRVRLLIYEESDLANPVHTVDMDFPKTRRNKSWLMWHCRVARGNLPSAGRLFYAYSVAGVAPGQFGFDEAKVLLDPYARLVFFPPGHSRASACRPGSNAGQAPLGVLAAPQPFDWAAERPRQADAALVIYELHVRNFTRRDDSIAPARRGTFLGVIGKIPYLADLGVTAVELMPVVQTDPQDEESWGYMPLNFFSPNGSYAASRQQLGQIDEFREMVKALHQAGIAVILDVVYNHTTEGNQFGPTYSFRGFSAAAYYLLDGASYIDDTGTGNTLKCMTPSVRWLVLDSLRYWVQEMHVDGFRFDLATVLTRDLHNQFDPGNQPLINEICSDPVLANILLIAEAWDATNLIQLGPRFPGQRWLQWNGRYRDTVRSFVKSDPGLVPDLMTRLHGSSDLFPDELGYARRASQSVNYVDAHDGFCLYDLVSYDNATDDAWDERSWNCGWEGDVSLPPDVRARRKRQIKNLFSLLMLSAGTPMFRAGDEFMNTQKGRRNPYNQDNESVWLDWSLLSRNQDMFRFFKGLVALRKRHPSLARDRFWRDDVKWFGTTGAVDASYDSHTLAFYLDGASQEDDDFYVMINAYWEDLPFRIQIGGATEWRRAVDTSLDSPGDVLADTEPPPLTAAEYAVKARSVVVLRRPRAGS